ncbi:hypothetical protein BpOF4_21434 (plasmid) [Alkalihalophilus pseudofirmus OF4]|uniref:Uncharacterized protein n=1 Tax=Alkalihalophilus pseudofirmus (strain ATCC BAA-2126 / JCM 17055 / OF4) TaxID=398511 RepID=D3G1Q6_ALKPO|nr:hypothetical protein [Alkalihalophilus pseudofirmus]ADC52282.1 hypothetical protein BpOF4_21434 [Alkalihalophilus pseudofirmus OF4]
MKKRVNFLSEAFAVVFFTLMVVIDFFPDIGINMSIGAIGVVTFILLAVITRHKGEPVFSSKKQELIFIVLSGIYFFSLLIILSLLGGVSQVGIGITNPILWGLYLIGVLTSYTKYKKELKQSNNNESGTFE